ncbi:NPCBM/NEW2 domain-containing protein [Deinococcus radiopugnans]|uniref:NPCBM/NEW2 domain-containing protein n=1 Tax=Deinococcus radiopugnans TaxID=57497 RepID=UPI0006922BBB|nr:NPCBM/NEW2 domain-containing protein [Deinococcus radiopugnans]
MNTAPKRTRLKELGLILLGMGLLIGCSSPDSPKPEPTGPENPYAGGATHPWTDGNQSGSKPIRSGENFLSEVGYTAASNAWGPIELDRSNGSEQPGDGGPLKIGNQTFAKGIGVHANSELTYVLNGSCSTFSATVGIDAEVGTKGSVVFQVLGDGKKLFDSGTMTGTSAAKPFSVSVAGVDELKLVVTDAGDGIEYDHADWADAKLSCQFNNFNYTAIANQSRRIDGKIKDITVAEAQGRAVGGQLYVFGGFDSLKSCCVPTDRAQRYDPATNVWTPLSPMPNGGATHAGMATDGQNIYYAGGYITNSSKNAQIYGTKAAWRYNVALDTYTPLPDLPVDSAAGQLEYLAGKLHYFGGTNSARTSDLNTHYVLDLNKNGAAWVQVAPLLQARNHLGSAVLDGVIYAIGGQTGHDEKLKTLNTVEAYDPATDRWEARADMPQALSHTTNSTFVLNGRIVVAGGETAHDQPTDAVTAYDPRSNTWTALTPLPQRRVSGVAAPLGDGFVFTGGNLPGGGGTKADGWRASPVTAP